MAAKCLKYLFAYARKITTKAKGIPSSMLISRLKFKSHTCIPLSILTLVNDKALSVHFASGIRATVIYTVR